MPAGYYVQVGAFSDKRRALALRARVRKAGWPAQLIPKGHGLLAVAIGPYLTRKEASHKQQRILGQLHLKGYPIQYQQ
ncbi:MAG: SPOR domain-containing protein [Zetaproteobacteria bacterium]|nr:MAG: SPOR domain-containing protein [Zetaproteobacteria bacterium]